MAYLTVFLDEPRDCLNITPCARMLAVHVCAINCQRCCQHTYRIHSVVCRAMPHMHTSCTTSIGVIFQRAHPANEHTSPAFQSRAKLTARYPQSSRAGPLPLCNGTHTLAGEARLSGAAAVLACTPSTHARPQHSQESQRRQRFAFACVFLVCLCVCVCVCVAVVVVVRPRPSYISCQGDCLCVAAQCGRIVEIQRV